MLFRPDVWVILNPCGVWASKKDFTICLACDLLTSPPCERSLISRLSSNQAERASALPCIMYFPIGMNTSLSLDCASAWRQKVKVSSTMQNFPISFIRSILLQIPSRFSIFVKI